MAEYPPFTFKKTSNTPQFTDYFERNSIVWQYMADKHPYRRARLVHYNFDTSKRWYVVFYAWNVSTERLERKRIFGELNRGKKSVRERIDIGSDMVVRINTELTNGKVLGKKRIKNINATSSLKLEKFTILGAIDFFIERQRENKRRLNYLRRFETIKKHISEFYEYKVWDDINIRDLDEEFLDDFFDFIRPKCGSNKTYNNYRNDISIIVNFLNKTRPKDPLFKYNPVHSITKLRVVNRKHAAFTTTQLRSIIDTGKKNGFTMFVTFVQMMYYTLARPVELLALRGSDIQLDQERILIRGEISKNWRDEYVSINENLKNVIIQAGLDKIDANHFIFSKTHGPGPDPIGDFHFWSKMDFILKELKFKEINKYYSLYSVKHTGVIDLYLATKDIMAVMEQCRHTSIEQTQIYLRDLGLLRKDKPVVNFKGTI